MAEIAKAELTTSQKAAAVIVSLGAEKASLLYQYMEPADLELLTLEVARLGMMDAAQTEEVLTEFYQSCLTNKAVTEGGLEYARAVLEKAFGSQTASALLEKVTKSLKNREFAFLNKADVKSLYSALQNERPQTMALVLAYVDPDKAAGVIEQLPPERQVKVVEAIATMESASPAAIKIIEAEMERKFSNMITNSNVKVGGIDYVANIMNNLDRSSEKSIFDRLSVNNEELCPARPARLRPAGSGALPQDGQYGGCQQALYQHVRPYGGEHPGRPGDYHQCPHEGRGGRPAAYRGHHPRPGGEERNCHPEGRKGRYHCITFSRDS